MRKSHRGIWPGLAKNFLKYTMHEEVEFSMEVQRSVVWLPLTFVVHEVLKYFLVERVTEEFGLGSQRKICYSV